MISILISADSRYKVDKEYLKQVAISALEGRRIKGKVELSISIVGGRAMIDLNKKYLKRLETTDVLAFPQEETIPVRQASEHTHQRQGFGGQGKVAGFVRPPDKVLRLGDIIISYPKALDQAANFNLPIEEELATLLEHGIDHLLGIHHE